MSFAQAVLFTQTYPGSPSTYTNSYTSSFNVTTNGYKLTYAKINNGQSSNNWTAIRSGSKNGVSVATITSEQIDKPIAKVAINFTQVNASVTNALYLEVSASSDFASATKIEADIATGTVEFAIAAPVANQYYRVTLDQAQGTANGFNRWDKVIFYEGQAASGDIETIAAPEYSVADATFTTPFTLEITSEEGTTLKYTLDNTDPNTSATAVEVTTNKATVEIAKSTVVKAIAIKGELVSVTKSKTYSYVNTPETAYTVAEAIEVINSGLGLDNELYAKGEIYKIDSYNSTYKSITYWIKDEANNQLQVYSGRGLNNTDFTSKDDLVIGSKVVICGILKKFNSTYEFDKSNYIVSLELPVAKFNVTATAENGTVTGAGEYEENAEATLTATANEGYEFTCWTSGEDTVSTANPYTFAVTANVALVANFKEVVVEEPVEAKLYLTPNANWKQSNARFAAYFFDNGETWVGMTKVAGETDLYEVTIPTDKKYPKVIFCRMNPGAAANNWNNKWNQTADLVIPTDGKNHYTVKDGTWDNGGGTWSIWPVPTVKTYVDITITVTANAPASIKWANAGDKLADATEYVAMTAGENNTYTYTLAQVDELKGVDYTVKVGEAVSATQNTSKNVTADFKALLPQVAVQGVNNWDGTDKMTIADDYLTASITLPLVAKKYDLKLTVDATWKGTTSNKITRENNSSAFTGDSGNGSITADIAGDYVFTYTYATQTLTVTYPALTVKYNVTVTAENGTVEGAGEYEENAEATLTATAAEGYEFVNWTVGDSIVSTENPYKFTVTADVALVANFKAVEPEIEWIEMPLEITNLVTEVMEVEGAKYLQLAGRNDMNDADVTLFLNNYADVDDDYEVNAEYSYMTFGGMEFTVIEGVMTQTSETDKGTIYTGTVYASVTDEEEGGTMYVKFALTMYAAPATVLVLTDAIVAINEKLGTLTFNVPTGEGEGYFVELSGYTAPGVHEGPQICLLETPEVVAYTNYAETSVVDGVITLTGEFTSQMGAKFDLTISGKLPVVEPTTITYELNGGELPTATVPTQDSLIAAFKDGYNAYFGVSVATTRVIDNFLYAGAAVNNPTCDVSLFMKDDASPWKWLGDYVLAVTNAQIEAGLLVNLKELATELMWRQSLTGFFLQQAKLDSNYKGNADFTEAGKPEAWGAAYQAAHAVVLPTEPVTEDYVLPTPVKEGCKFVGWYDNAEGTGEAYTVIPAGWAGTLYAIWEVEGPGTALENIAVEGKAVKAIVNGQLIIIKNGVQYNAQGQVVK